jgi:ABC-2 type transport system permease protein
VVEILFVLVQVAMVGIYFNFTDNISGWTKAQVFLLIGLFRIIEGIFHIFFHKNLLNFPELISSGNLDIFLTRPINSLFISTTRYHNLDEIGTFITGVLVVWYSLVQLKIDINIILIFKLIFVISFGLLAIYSVILIFSVFSFFFTRLTALNSVYDIITKTLRVPTNVLTQDTFIGNTILFPLIIVVTLPSQIILGQTGFSLILIEALSSIILFTVAYKFYFFALRRYSSASS